MCWIGSVRGVDVILLPEVGSEFGTTLFLLHPLGDTFNVGVCVTMLSFSFLLEVNKPYISVILGEVKGWRQEQTAIQNTKVWLNTGTEEQIIID